MNNLYNKNMPPDDIIYADFSCATDGEAEAGHDIDDMIFSSLPEIKIYSER